MKIDFEIAVDQKTKAHDQTFEGVPDSGCPPVPAGQPHPYLVNFWLKTMRWGTLSKSDKNWPSYKQNTICPYLGIRNKYYRFWPINWANINIE